MFTIAIHEGRLLECRIASPVTVEEVSAFAAKLKAALASTQKQVVICCDVRRANVFPPEVSDAWVKVMKSDNPRVERSGFLVGESAMFGLQVERMIRDAGNPHRRAFRDLAQATAFVGELLDSQERARLSAFVAEST